MKKKRPSDDVYKRVDRLLIRHKTLKEAREHSAEELQTALQKRVEQYTKYLPHGLTDEQKDRLTYNYARLAAFEKDHKRLQKENDDYRDDLFEGAFFETLIHDLRPSPDSKKKMEEAKISYREKRQRKFLGPYEQMIRDRKISRPHFGEWLSPMPVFSEKEPFGFCQATGESRDVIRAFLKTIKVKKTGQRQRGRGRPQILYSVDTNLRVMDQWIGKWVHQTPRNVCIEAHMTYLVTIGIYAAKEIEIPATARQFKRFRRIVIKHLNRVRAKIEDSYIQQMADDILNGPDPS
jgi:hypothetical protein